MAVGPATVAVLAFLLLVPAMTYGTSVSGTISTSGAVSIVLYGSDPNGSSLRSAMDGNFAPLIDSLPINASEKATLLGAIATDESGLVGAFLFGNRDGTVEANEVTLFETAIDDSANALSATGLGGNSTALSLGGLLSLTLDGTGPTSATFGGVAFTGAVGPDSSPAPIGIGITLDDQFASSGSTHTLALGTNVSGLGTALSLIAPSIDVNLTFPSGTAVTGSSGFTAVSLTPDPLGWSSPSVSATYSPASSANVSITYGPAFPVGDALLVAVPLAAIAILAGVLLWRRRRRRAAAPA